MIAENQLLKALPKMAKAASSPELKQAFEEHLEVTEQHVNRLEQVFQMLGAKAKGKKCEAMKGLIEEGKEMMSQRGANDVLDAGLIGAAQKVEHYEIAGYGTVTTYAKMLGHQAEAELLHQTLEEEKATDEKLTLLAKEGINLDALEAEEEKV